MIFSLLKNSLLKTQFSTFGLPSNASESRVYLLRALTSTCMTMTGLAHGPSGLNTCQRPCWAEAWMPPTACLPRRRAASKGCEWLLFHEDYLRLGLHMSGLGTIQYSSAVDWRWDPSAPSRLASRLYLRAAVESSFKQDHHGCVYPG